MSAELRRLTPEGVKAAFQKIGMRPLKGRYYREGCCCPMVADGLASGEFDLQEFLDRSHQLKDWFSDMICKRLNREYALGVMAGIDRTDGDDDLREIFSDDQINRWRLGLEDGRKIAAELFHDPYEGRQCLTYS